LVYGVLYSIEEKDKDVLDTFEGVGFGYRCEMVNVLFGEDTIEAVTCIAMNCDPSLKPFSWYKEHVVQGAIEIEMPSNYVDTIRGTTSRIDPDRERAEAELSIYQ